MKTFIKFIIGLLILSAGYFALSDVSAFCTLPPLNGSNCNDGEDCTLTGGCNCLYRDISDGEMCFFNEYITQPTVDALTSYAISGTTVNFQITLVNYKGDKFFRLQYPYETTYGLQLGQMSETPLFPVNPINPYPIFSLASGETKTLTFDFTAYTTDRSLPVLNITGEVSQASDFIFLFNTIQEVVNPIGEILVQKSFTGNSASFSGDMVTSMVTLTNIGSLAVTGITYTDAFPFNVLGMPTVTFDGIAFGYNATQLPNILIWSGSYLDLIPGQTVTILADATVIDNFAPGTQIVNTASITTPQPQLNTGDDSATVTGSIVAYIDLVVDQSNILGNSPQALGDSVEYEVVYSNAGNDTATGVQFVYSISGTSISSVTTTLPDLADGATATLNITGLLDNNYPAGTEICLVGSIQSVVENGPTTNNDVNICHIVEVDGTSIDMIVNNITRPALDNAPYGTNQDTLIQAVSGDTIRFTIYYGNDGNIQADSVLISLAGLGGATLTTSFNGVVGTLIQDQTGVIIIDAIVGPQNFLSFNPVVTLTYTSNTIAKNITDTLTVEEPFVCGDGLLTRTEVCDTNGPLGNISAGQACENQQGTCVLVTYEIVNSACIDYQFTDPIDGLGTGQACSTATMPLAPSTCNTLTQGASTTSGTTTNIAFTCDAQNAYTSTAITINCGNGTTVSGNGTSVSGTCNYAAGFEGTATCLVGNETLANNSCTSSVGEGECEVITLDGDMIILDEDGDGYMPVLCEASDGSELSNADVDCGSSDGSYDDGVCEYNNVDPDDVPDIITISCDSSTVSCETDVLMDEGFLGECGNDIREGYEQCDDGDDNGTSYSDCSDYCSLEDYTPPACFYINNQNISVQEDEYLPFWRKLETEGRTTSYCDDDNDVGKIVEDSLRCTFNLYNGEYRQSDDNPLETFTEDCDEDNRGTSQLFDNDLFGGSNPYGKYKISVDFTRGIYGEYKLILDSVNYDVCVEDEDGTFIVEGDQVNRICEVNFTVTRPYLAQKSAFGLTPQSTDINLDGYQDINGDELIRSTDLDDIMTIDASDYDGGREVQDMMDEVIEKYSRLGVEISKSQLGSVPGIDDVTKLQKVPNRQIYILEGNGDITLGGSFDTPVTFITKGLDIHIEGDLTTNSMFLVKDGKIWFDEPSDARCDKTQEVKGIFVTDKKFSSFQLANTMTTRQRCEYGGLHVKGVLIGDGIEDLVKARRSQLNSRFYLTSDRENRIEAQRRNKIFNGAAVLIEYSPSLRSNLPPAADEFTEALEVYKQ